MQTGDDLPSDRWRHVQHVLCQGIPFCWVMGDQRRVRPLVWALRYSSTAALVSWSRPVKGSSRTRISPGASTARATATRRFMPPLRVRTGREGSPKAEGDQMLRSLRTPFPGADSGDVGQGREVLKQAVFLEHRRHREGPPQNTSAVWLLQSQDETKQGGFPQPEGPMMQVHCPPGNRAENSCRTT